MAWNVTSAVPSGAIVTVVCVAHMLPSTTLLACAPAVMTDPGTPPSVAGTVAYVALLRVSR